MFRSQDVQLLTSPDVRAARSAFFSSLSAQHCTVLVEEFRTESSTRIGQFDPSMCAVNTRSSPSATASPLDAWCLVAGGRGLGLGAWCLRLRPWFFRHLLRIPRRPRTMFMLSLAGRMRGLAGLRRQWHLHWRADGQVAERGSGGISAERKRMAMVDDPSP
jgi:hypothetical protein